MSEIAYPKYRWYVLIAVIVATMAQGMILIAPTPLMGEIAKSLNMDLGAATAVSMLPFTFVVSIGALFGGVVLDKLGVGKTFVGACLLVAVSSMLIPVFGKDAFGLALLRALQGLGCGPIIASGPRLAAEWFPPKQRGLFQGVQGAALSLGITIGLMTGPAIAAGSGWNFVMVWFGSLMAVATIMFVLYNFGPKSPGSMKLEIMGHSAEVEFKKVLGLPMFWAALVAAFALSWVMQGYNDLTPGHIAVPGPVGLGLGPQTAGNLMGLYSLAFMFGSLTSGFVAEKIFKGKYKTAITVCFLLTAIFCSSVLLPVVNSNQGLLMICLILAGFFMGMPNPINLTFISNSYPENLTGRVGGITMGLSMFGGTIAVAVGSFALHATGMYTMSILIVVFVAIIGALSAFGMNASKNFAPKANDQSI